jgi:hypothetical protein
LNFTNSLLSIIRQQRHLATRVLIATQEPTLSPSLIDLCNVTIVHRFLSPAWFETLKNHLAGASFAGKNDHRSIVDTFRIIVGLKTGEALLFSPTAMLDIGARNPSNPFAKRPLEKLTDSFIRLFIRKRVTTDGGRSIMASDGPAPPPLGYGSDASDKDLSETSDSEAEVILRSSSRFGRAAPAPRQRSHASSKRQGLALQGPSQNLQDTAHHQQQTRQLFQTPSQQTSAQMSKKAKNPPPPAKSPAQPQPQQVSKKATKPLPPKSPAQPQPQPQPPQVSKKAQNPPPPKSPAQPHPQQAGKQAKNTPMPAKSPAHPQPQQGQQQLSKKQRKALNKAALAADPQPQQGQQQLIKKHKKALNMAALSTGPGNNGGGDGGDAGGDAGGNGGGSGTPQQTQWIRQPGVGGRLSRSTTDEDDISG